jgi:hypothetical protein
VLVQSGHSHNTDAGALPRTDVLTRTDVLK